MHSYLLEGQAKPITCELKDLEPISIILVNGTNYEPIWDQLVRRYHYLGYSKMYGPRVKYLVASQEKLLAAISYNRATLKVGVRDRYIGWDDALKRQHLDRVVCNNRLLILPWVRVQNLASYLLSKTLTLLRQDWLCLYGTSLFLAETFVDRSCYEGTCYKGAGWQELGQTQGFAKAGKVYIYHGNRKTVFVKVLDKRFRKQLGVMPDSRPLHMCKVKRGRGTEMMLFQPDYDPEILNECGITEDDASAVSDMLQRYLDNYQPCYRRSDQKRLADTFIKGLLSDLERKSIEPVALRYSGIKGVRPMQMFFKHSTFDDEKMLKIYQNELASLIADEDGMLNIDGSDFPKKGSNSIGVARQYCGILGKTENCQAGVFIGYTSTKGYGLVDRRLYMPQKWFAHEYTKLRKQCGVPEELVFSTKTQLASNMLKHVIADGCFPAKWIGCDSAFGCDREFLESLPKSCYYFADVRSSQLVFPGMPEMQIPPPKATGRKHKYERPSFPPVKVADYAVDESTPWQRIILAEGAKGPIIADVKCVRCVSCYSSTKYGNYVVPKEPVWLYIRRYANGRIKYSLCNAPEDTPMEVLNRVATMRWPIEQCFEECKSIWAWGITKPAPTKPGTGICCL
ncbi:MAG: IS701 family transposase [Actinobacteria bacterium]|nr:IS701 family transposase [Actinomycetota bacterium]